MILESNVECSMWRLSFLLVAKVEGGDLDSFLRADLSGRPEDWGRAMDTNWGGEPNVPFLPEDLKHSAMLN